MQGVLSPAAVARRPRRHLIPRARPGLALALVLFAGCPANSDDVRAPRDQLVSPTGLALSPDESVLFVSNANSELRYDSGSVLVVDLQEIDNALAGWLSDRTAPAGCTADRLQPAILECDESIAIHPDRGVRIGSFGTEIGVQDLGPDRLRLVVAVRGDPSVTWIDYLTPEGRARPELVCAGAEENPLCDGDNRLVSLRNDFDLQALVPEPFGVHVGSAGDRDYAIITHLVFANVSVVDLPRGSGPGAQDIPAPVLSDSLGGLFAPDPTGTFRSALGVAGRPSDSGAELVYITSRSEDRVRVAYVDQSALGAILVPVESFFLNGVQPSDDSRGIVFNQDGTRAYIVNRFPAILHVIDTSAGATGSPRNQAVGFVEICRNASNIATARVAGRGDRVYVACFPGGQVWAIDPEVSRDPVAIINVGRGPHEVVVAAGRNRLYVTNVLEDTISVVDLTPGAATENRMVMRLGIPRQQEEGQD